MHGRQHHRRRNRRRLTGVLGLGVLLLGLWVPVADAHTGFTVGPDDATVDSTVTGTDGTTIKVRVIKPTSGGPFPVVIYKGGTGATRCPDLDIMSRAELASFGYAVVGMTGRGMPDKTLAGNCNGGNQAADINDSLNDSGSDVYGPNDIQDIKDVITWASAQTWADASNVGYLGHSHDGALAYFIAKNDSRVKAVVADAGLSLGLKGGNVAAVSNKPTPSMFGLTMGYSPFGSGIDVNYDPAVLDNMTRWNRSKFLRTTPSAAVTAWMNDRTVVDDDSAVDKAHLITTPVFITHGWLDNYISPENAIQAYNKLPTGNKYLYLGACNGHGNPCLTANKAYIKGKVHAFFDKYLKGTAGSIGGPIFYAVPPLNPLTTDNWTVTESTSATFPPATTNTPIYLRTGGVLSDTAPTTAEAADTISAPNQTSPIDDFCKPSLVPKPGEFATYTSPPLGQNTKMLGLDADLYLSSTQDRLQVFVYVSEVAPGGVETPLWALPQEVVVATSYGQAAGTHVHFQFKPISWGWTWTQGNQIRIKVSSNLSFYYAAEPVPATYSIHHTATEQSKIVLHWLT